MPNMRKWLRENNLEHIRWESPDDISAHNTPAYNINGYRFYEDDGATPTPIAAANTPITREPNSIFHVRLAISETNNGQSNNDTFQLQVQYAGGGYTNLTSTSTYAQIVSSAFRTGEQAIAEDATIGTGNNSGSLYTDVTDGVANTTTQYDYVGNDHIEVDFTVILTDQVADGQDVTFRSLVSGATPSVSQTATVTASVAQTVTTDPNDLIVDPTISQPTLVQQHFINPLDQSVDVDIAEPAITQQHFIYPNDLDVAVDISQPTATPASATTFVAVSWLQVDVTPPISIQPNDLSVDVSISQPTVSGPPPAEITPTQLTSGGNGADQSAYNTAIISPTADSVVHLALTLRDTAGEPPTPVITGCGLTWSLVGSAWHDESGTLAKHFLYRGTSSTPSSGAVTITHPSAPTTYVGALWAIDEFVGVNNPSAPDVQTPAVNFNSTGAASLDATFGSAITSGNAVIASASKGVFGTPATWEAGFTGLSEFGLSDEDEWTGIAWDQEGSDNVVSITGIGGEKVALIAVEYAPAPVAPITITPNDLVVDSNISQPTVTLEGTSVFPNSLTVDISMTQPTVTLIGSGVMSWSVIGAPASDSCQVKAKFDAATVSAKLVVATDSALTQNRHESTVQTPDVADCMEFNVTSLNDDTDYFYGVEVDNQSHDPAKVGTFHTLPTPGTQYSFTIVHTHCWQTPNHAVLDHITDIANPLIFFFLGDFDYDNNTGASASAIRTSYEGQFAVSRLQQLARKFWWVSVWDDHDWAGNNSNGTIALANKQTRSQEWQRYFPHNPLVDGSTFGAIYRAFTVGRVRFIVLDERYYSDNHTDTDDANKTMWGTAQKTWLFNELTRTQEKLFVVIHSRPFVSTDLGSDDWGEFQTERTEFFDEIESLGITNVLHWQGDMHGLAAADDLQYDTGTNGSQQICLCGGSANQTGSYKGGPYTLVGESGEQAVQGPAHYGYLTFTDNGTSIDISWEGRESTTGTTYTVEVPTSGNPLTHSYTVDGVFVQPNNLFVSVDAQEPTVTVNYQIDPDDLVVDVDVASPTLTQLHDITPNDISVDAIISRPALTQTGILSPDNLSVDVNFSQPTLVQQHFINPLDLDVVVDTSQPTLVQNYNITPDNLSIDSIVSSPTLTQLHNIQPNDLDVTVNILRPVASVTGTAQPLSLNIDPVISQPDLTQQHFVNPLDIDVVVVAERPTITYVVQITPNDLSVSIDVASPTLTQQHFINPLDLSVDPVITRPFVTGVGQIQPLALVVDTNISQPTLVQTHFLSANDLSVDIDISQPSTTVTSGIDINDLSVDIDISSPTLVQTHVLQPNSLIVDVSIQRPTLLITGTHQPRNLAVDISIQQPTLTQQHFLFSDDLSVDVNISAPTAIQVVPVQPLDLVVLAITTRPTLQQTHVLSPHDLLVDSIVTYASLFQQHFVYPNDLSVSAGMSQPIVSDFIKGIPIASRTIKIAARDSNRVIRIPARGNSI